MNGTSSTPTKTEYYAPDKDRNGVCGSDWRSPDSTTITQYQFPEFVIHRRVQYNVTPLKVDALTLQTTEN